MGCMASIARMRVNVTAMAWRRWEKRGLSRAGWEGARVWGSRAGAAWSWGPVGEGVMEVRGSQGRVCEHCTDGSRGLSP